MLDATESWLNYIDLPAEYPGTDGLVRDLDDAISEAIADVMREWKARDPLLRAMLDERYALWTWATVPACQLPVGTLVRSGTWTGRIQPARPLHPNHPPDTPPHWVSIGWERTEAYFGRYGPSIGYGEQIEAYVPVPFDLAPLVAEFTSAMPPAAPTAPAVLPKPKRTGTAVRLTPPQVELLTDIATNPAMWISCHSRWDRTARVLIRLGLAKVTEDGLPQYELRITEPAGKAEAVRRGIITDPK